MTARSLQTARRKQNAQPGAAIGKGLASYGGNPRCFAALLGNGWVPERSNGLAWKACVPHKGTEGSNPSPSASIRFGFLEAQHSRAPRAVD